MCCFEIPVGLSWVLKGISENVDYKRAFSTYRTIENGTETVEVLEDGKLMSRTINGVQEPIAAAAQ